MRLTVGIFPFEPFNFFDDAGIAQGLYPDLLRKMGKDEEWQVEFIQCNWGECLNLLQKQELDLMVSVAYSPERAEIMDYSDTSAVELWGQVFIRPDGRSDNINDLAGKRVGVMRKDISGENFIETTVTLGVQCDIVEFASHGDVFDAVEKKEVEAGVAPQYFGLRHAKEYNLVGSSILFSPFSIYFASKKGTHHEVLGHINTHLAKWKMDKDSYYYKRFNYWLGSHDSSSYIPMWLIYGTVIAVSLALLFAGFILILRRTIRNKVQALAMSEARLKEAQEIAKLGRWEFDQKKKQLYWSQTIFALLELDPESYTPSYETFFEYVHPDDRVFVEQTYTESVENRIPYEIENRFQMKDGRIKWGRVTGKTEYDDKGLPARSVGIVQDITTSKLAEQALRESEQKFKRMFDQAPMSYQSLDREGNFIEVNNTWLQVMGYSRAEVIGKNFSVFLVPEWKDHFKLNFPRFKAVGEVLGVEFEMVKKDGSRILVSFHGKISKGQSGESVQTHCVFNDVTNQRSAEETLKNDLELNRAIADISKEFLSKTYEIKKVSGAILNALKRITGSEHGLVSSIDQKTLENVGQALTTMLGENSTVKTQKIVFPIGDDGRYGGLWGYALNTRQSFFTNTPETHPSSKGLPQGHVPLKNYLAVPVLIGDTLLGLIALANSDREYSQKDIVSVNRIAEIFALAIHRQEYETQRTVMEQNLRQLQKNEAIGALAGGIAHDFNNILSPIIGYAEILEQDISKDSPSQESLHQILSAADRAKGLVRQILTFSRQTEQEIKPLKPQSVLKEVTKLIKATIPTTIEIKENIADDCRTIVADPTQIHQVAMNLLTNAYHAMHEKGGTLTITLRNIDFVKREHHLHLEAGPHIMLSIQDTGIGMARSTQEKIFDPYYTTKSKDKGTGLGLSVVYGIVKKYKGELEVKSVLGHGTEFIVYLPAIGQKESVEKKREKSIAPAGTEKLLIVDDEVAILDLQRRTLSRLGYQVEVMNSSEDALLELKSFPEKYDLLVTDMTMPKMTGDILTQEIRKFNSDLPIIICTGFSETMTPERVKFIGANGLLFKPVAGVEMAQNIRELLDNKSPQRER